MTDTTFLGSNIEHAMLERLKRCRAESVGLLVDKLDKLVKQNVQLVKQGEKLLKQNAEIAHSTKQLATTYKIKQHRYSSSHVTQSENNSAMLQSGCACMRALHH